MALIDKREATRSDLKWFGLAMAGCFAVLGAMAWLRGHHRAAFALWSVGGGMALLYYTVLPIQRFTFDFWMAVTYPIGWVVSHLMMLVMFYLVLTPVGLMMRLFGRDPMERTLDRAASSYWVPHDPSADPGRYFRQF